MHNYCQKCVYPIHAVNLDIDDEGVCSACRTFDEIVKLDDSNWLKRKEKYQHRVLELFWGIYEKTQSKIW